MNLRDLPDMSDALKEVQAIEEKKKEKELDPVGQEDADVDNDGDSDSSDEYLKKRRKAIAKAMKKEEVEQVDEADSLAAMAARREKRLARQRKQMGTTATGQDFGHDYGISSAERKKRQQAEFDAFIGRGKKTKKEAFLFSDEELESLVAIDEATDEELIAFFEEIISEMAEDDQDLIEICEALEDVELLSEDYYDSAVKASKAASKTPEAKAGRRKLRVQRMKSAAKAAGAKLKAGAKAAGSAAKKAGKAAVGAGARAAGHAVGEFQAQRIKSKRAAMERTPAKKKEAPKSSDDDGTGGKLDKLLADTRGKSSSSGSSSSGGGGSSDSGSSSSGSTRRAVGGALRKVGSLLKKGLKKAVGKTARAVSKGSDKLAKRMNEDYDKIASLYESGLFSIEEIENVIEEGYKEIDRKKENAMYRRAGNLSREALSKGMNTKEGSKAQDKSGKIVSAISRQKEKERFSKMADIKARSNYGG